MDDTEFDRALIAAAFEQLAQKGWPRLSVADAARAAGLPLDRARLRLPGRGALLLKFGRMADQAALADAAEEGSSRDRLFGLLMRRIDVLQAHRGGVLALLAALPADPLLALVLAGTNLRSMAWMLQAAGVSTAGPAGALRAKALVGIWLWTLRTWRDDTSPDLARTMATLDHTLLWAERWSRWLGGTPATGDDAASPSEPEPPFPEEPPPAPAPPGSAPTIM
jgi:ubiquinone biosynthesis protein COQ9